MDHTLLYDLYCIILYRENAVKRDSRSFLTSCFVYLAKMEENCVDIDLGILSF